jgi:nitrite reductase/ring-hydroxylating ferredoxin subunit
MKFLKDILNRRTFLKRLVFAILSLEILYVFTGLLKKRGQSKEAENLIEAGHESFFEKDKVYPFSAGHFYLSRLEDGGFLAISTKCTHLGCTIQFNTNRDRFVCPCHASAFNKYGEVLSPPATRALDLYPVLIKEGKLFVDVTKPTKRQKYSPTQLTYA